MMQPSTTSGAVAKPNSSAPSSAPITTSRPVFIWPSACTRMRPRRRFSTSVCCVSARPSSHGVPACLIDDQRRRAGAAVVAGDHDVIGLAPWRRPRRPCRRPTSRHQLDADARRAGSRSSGRGSAAPDPRSNRCRGAAAAKSGRRPAPSSAACRCTRDTLWPGNWPPSPGFAPCAILIWIWSADDEVLGRHAEAARRDLLDLRAQRIAVLQRDSRRRLSSLPITRLHRVAVLDRNAAQFVAIARRVLAAFAGVRLAADAVHRDRQRGVRLGARSSRATSRRWRSA